MIDFGMGRSWSANQRRPHSAKENVDYFMDKKKRRRPPTAADVPPANRKFRTCSRAAHLQSYASCTHATELVLDRPGFSETFDLLDST